MCTVSWLRTASGFELFCNRDELVTRLPASAPAVQARDGVRFAAPRDGDFGGTWILANERGLALCLLNRVLGADEPPAPVSRGLLVASLASASGADEVASRLDAADLTAYRGFVLLALEPERPAFLAEWDGARLASSADAERRSPLFSSTPDPERVRANRLAALGELEQRFGSLSGECLAEFHKSHRGGPGALSTCMHREAARTQSFTRVAVDATAVRMRYADGPRCTADLGPILVLARGRR
jgi:hypothetical protein